MRLQGQSPACSRPLAPGSRFLVCSAILGLGSRPREPPPARRPRAALTWGGFRLISWAHKGTSHEATDRSEGQGHRHGILATGEGKNGVDTGHSGEAGGVLEAEKTPCQVSQPVWDAGLCPSDLRFRSTSLPSQRGDPAVSEEADSRLDGRDDSSGARPVAGEPYGALARVHSV